MTKQEYTKRKIQRRVKRIIKEIFSLGILLLFIWFVASYIDITQNNMLPGQEFSSWNIFVVLKNFF